MESTEGGRSIGEWIGRNDDDPVPRRVRVRVFIRADGCCANCRRRLRPGDKWICDHIIALINGGENRERNLQVLCDWCNKSKTIVDVGLKSKNYRRRAAHIGVRAKKYRSFSCGKDSAFKKKIDGTVVRREDKP